jgi:hypothetical protein
MDAKNLQIYLPLLTRISEEKLGWIEYCFQNSLDEGTDVLQRAKADITELQDHCKQVEALREELTTAVQECKNEQIRNLLEMSLKGWRADTLLCLMDLITSNRVSGNEKYMKKKEEYIEALWSLVNQIKGKTESGNSDSIKVSIPGAALGSSK